MISNSGSHKHDSELLNEIGRETQLCVDRYVNSAEVKGVGPRNQKEAASRDCFTHLPSYLVGYMVLRCVQVCCSVNVFSYNSLSWQINVGLVSALRVISRDVEQQPDELLGQRISESKSSRELPWAEMQGRDTIQSIFDT